MVLDDDVPLRKNPTGNILSIGCVLNAVKLTALSSKLDLGTLVQGGNEVNTRPITAGASPAETESAILEAARDLLAVGGLEGLSMRVLGERVGLTATAIYHYFEGKDALVRRVVERGYLRFGEYLEQAVATEPAGSLERLVALGEGYVRFAFENQEYFRVLYNIQAPEPREIDDLPVGGGYHLLRQCVIDAIAAGTLRESDPDLVSHYLWTCVHGLVTLSLACNVDAKACTSMGRPQSAVDLYRSFAPFVVDGLRARSNGETVPPHFLHSAAEHGQNQPQGLGNA